MIKRILVMCLSFTTIICYGYALGGMGGYMFGRGKPIVVAAGLIGGTLCALAALRIWKIYLDEIAKEDALLRGLSHGKDCGTEEDQA